MLSVNFALNLQVLKHMTAYQINHAGHLLYKNNSVVYQNVDFGFLCLISFLCDLRRLLTSRAAYPRPAL